MLSVVFINIAIIDKKLSFLPLIQHTKCCGEGRSENLLRGGEIARAQWAHQVSSAALYHLLVQAFNTRNDNMSFDEWRKTMEEKIPQFLAALIY